MVLSKFKIVILLLFSLSKTVVFSQTEENKLDNNGLKHGVWKGLYSESKRPRFEGTFVHGKETGNFKFFDDTKANTIIATREFNSNSNSAYTIFYDQNKSKVSEGKVVNRLFEGNWKYYHEGLNVVMTLENYKNGQLEGLRTVYYKSGIIAEEANYIKGKKDGLYKKYTEKGVVMEESHYTNGEYDGVAIFRDPDGIIVAKGKFIKGQKIGIWQFYQGGKLVSSEKMGVQRKKALGKKAVKTQLEIKQ